MVGRPTTITDAGPAAFSMSLFGPMAVSSGGRPIPRLRSRKALWLLALLALKHKRDVERHWLAGTLWPDVETAQGLANLRPTLSELRRALGSQAERLRADGRLAVSLDVEGAEIDVLTFDRLIDRESLAGLEVAVSLYKGPLLEGCTEDWVFQERDVRERACLRGLQKLAEHALASADHLTAICHCRRAIGIDPLWEAGHRCLMEALERSGDRNAALVAYRAFAERMGRELATTPDDQTTEIYERLRRSVRPRSRPESMGVPKVEPLRAVEGYVPHPMTALVGRDDERLEVAAKLRRSRLVTLLGPGGIGKTRLAIEVADDAVREGVTYPDGVWLVSLESLTEDRQVIAQMATALDVTEEAGRPIIRTITQSLRQKRLLLVLDNCEHLLAASADAVTELLRECAGLRVLATSREPLGITGEIAWPVPVLTVPDPTHLPKAPAGLMSVLAGYESVQLFCHRAQAVQSSFSLNQTTAQAVAQICSRLDGLPLAIELAAARISAMTAEQILARLNETLGLLTSGTGTAFARQQTLRASLDWSHSLLGDLEQRLLRRLSVFVGGWAIDAAAPVCAADDLPHGQILDLLTSLVDKSLVLFEEQETKSGAALGRFRLLDAVRQYAAHMLQGEELTWVRSRHRDYFLELAEEAEPRLTDADQGALRVAIEAERPNLLASLDWSRSEPNGAEAELRLVGALGKLWELRGYYSEGRSRLAEALARSCADNGTAARAKALTSAGLLAYHQGDNAESKALHEEALAIYRKLADMKGIGWSLNELADVASSGGDDLAAKELYEQSLSVFRELNDRNGIASLLHHLARVARDGADYARAKELYQEGLATQRELGNDLGVGWALHHLGNLALLQSDLLSAWSLQEQSRSIFEELGNRQGVAWTLSELARVAAAQGNLITARELCGEAIDLFREMGNRHGVAASLMQLGAIAGDGVEARRCYEESLEIRKAMGLRGGIADCLLAIAEMEVTEGRPQDAVVLWGAAESIKERPTARSAGIETARTQLGAEAFDAAWSAGAALSLDHAASRAIARKA